MKKPPPQTKEQIERDITATTVAKLQEAAGQIAATIATSYSPPDAIYLVTKLAGFIYGNLVKPEGTAVNGLLASSFETIRETTIETVRARQIGEAAMAKEVGDGEVR